MMLRTLDGSSYQRKLSAIASIKEMAELFGDDLEDRLLRHFNRWFVILESLPGRIWEAKTKLFDALQRITKHCGLVINKDLDLRSTMT